MNEQQLLIDGSEVPLATVDLPKINLRAHHLQILRSVYVQGPATDAELSQRLNLSENSIRPRRKELSERLYLEPDEQVRTVSGRFAQRWTLSMRGLEIAVKED